LDDEKKSFGLLGEVARICKFTDDLNKASSVEYEDKTDKTERRVRDGRWTKQRRHGLLLRSLGRGMPW